MTAEIKLLCLSVFWLPATFAFADGSPSDAQQGAMHAWAGAALLRQPPSQEPERAGLDLVRQDHGPFYRNRSSWDTAPLRLGDTEYEHGLGTHSVSEIVVRLEQSGKTFQAEAGIDNNSNTEARRGSVVFVVEVGGKEAFRSGVRRGSDPPLPIQVDLGGAKEFTLRVLDAGDGSSHDQADWADAFVTTTDGKQLYLDQMPLLRPSTVFSADAPFSFVYGGTPSSELLPGWKHERQDHGSAEGIERARVSYTDPETGLQMASDITVYREYPAVEWVLFFKNTGPQDTPLLENILPLDLRITTSGGAHTVFHYANGSTCKPDDFQPIAEPLNGDGNVKLAPRGGRSSNGRLPFFNLVWGQEGLAGAIGWSGQWKLETQRKGNQLALQAGQQGTHLKLRPGESLRTPRILLVGWQGDRIDGHNMMRQIVYRYHTPLLSGVKPLPPVQCNTWFPVGDDGGKANEQNQIELLRAYKLLGIEYLVMDAGWYGDTPVWWENVGTWRPRPDTFPNGIQPVGKVALEVGIRFGLWFEPERVQSGTQLDREHPEWLIKLDGQPNRLLNLGLPEVQEWFIDMVSRYIDEVPLGYFRHDFNMDPLPYWQHADQPDRVGMTEIRYIEGLYRIWDELRARYPDVMFEGCSSGGRRMDLESLGRCHTYWRSDLYGNSLANQGHIYGASLYLPGNYLNIPLFDTSEKPYALRSIFGGALCLGWDPREENFPVERAKARVDQFKALRHLAVGDFYPLLPHSLEATHWTGYQLHRPDLGEGMALLFRHEESPYLSLEIKLRGIDPEQTYEVTFNDAGQTRRLSGKELLDPIRVSVDEAPGSALITYQAVEEQ